MKTQVECELFLVKSYSGSDQGTARSLSGFVDVQPLYIPSFRRWGKTTTTPVQGGAGDEVGAHRSGQEQEQADQHLVQTQALTR